jgi:hypothetical protein
MKATPALRRNGAFTACPSGVHGRHR